MPVSDNFKLLEIGKDLSGNSGDDGNMQISVSDLVNLETDYGADTNRNDTSSEKSSRVGDIGFELNTSTTECELEVGKHLRCSVNRAKCGFSHGQCCEITSKMNCCDAQNSLPVTCQRTTEVFLKQTASESKPSCSRSFKSFGLSTAESSKCKLENGGQSFNLIPDWDCSFAFKGEPCETVAKLPILELRAVAEDLAQTVEEVSSELVSLLLENDALQQESDARNIAIEQLLKLTWKQTENELRPVQMSVILPSDASDNDVDD